MGTGTEKIDGVEAKYLVHTYQAAGEDVKACCYLLVKGNKGCVIMCLAAPKAYDRYKGRFAEIARSFKLN